MSWLEYKGKEAAVKFTQRIDPLHDDIAVKVMNALLLENNMLPIKTLGDAFCKFDLLLDVGCGSGGRIGSFVPYFKSTIGIDPSENLIQLAKERNASNDITYLVGCGEKMPVPDGSVDLATFIFSAHFMDMKKVEMELDRVLKPTGVATFYGSLVDKVELLQKDSDTVAFPELESIVTNLLKKCFAKFENYAIESNHPTRHKFDKFQKLYNRLHILDKSRLDDVKNYTFATLEQFVFAYSQAIPFYKNAVESMDFNPMGEFRDEVKKLWKISDVDDKDVLLRFTRNSFFIFLKKKTKFD